MRAVGDHLPTPLQAEKEEKERKGSEWHDTHVAPVLPERAPQEGPRSTAAVGANMGALPGTPVPPRLERGKNKKRMRRKWQVPSLLAERAR